jgi:hypothetical protein
LADGFPSPANDPAGDFRLSRSVFDSGLIFVRRVIAFTPDLARSLEVAAHHRNNASLILL